MLKHFFFSILITYFISFDSTRAQGFKTINGRTYLSGPGYGWNYLTNEIKVPSIEIKYHSGSTTNDGSYDIPDCMFAYDNKRFQYLGNYAMIESGKSFESLTAKSMKVEASGSFSKLSFSGSYSQEWKKMRSEQQTLKSITIRDFYSADMYSLLLTTSCPISSSFRADIDEIVTYMESNDAEIVKDLVRDVIDNYGTHYLNEVNIGAFIYSEDYLKESYWLKKINDMHSITTASSASFFAKIKLETSVSVSNEEKTSYATNTTNSKVDAYGGFYSPGMSAADWSKTIENNMVIIDRKGKTLDTLITQRNFPKLNNTLLQLLKTNLNDGIISYIKEYGVDGCMNRNASNFNSNANTHNESICTESLQIFGGVFGYYNDSSMTWTSNNFQMNSLSCPNGFSVHNVVSVSSQFSRNYEINQCFSDNPTLNGYLFGGFYYDSRNNIVTGAETCPPNYTRYRLFDRVSGSHLPRPPAAPWYFVSLCFSEYNIIAKQYAIEFAGFVASCESKSTNYVACPNGFINQYGFTLRDCIIYFCVKPK